MTQFHAYRLAGDVYVMDCQSDSLSHLRTRVVAPLLPLGEVPAPNPRLHPTFELDGEALVLATHLLATMPVRDLGQPVAALDDRRYEIVSALDLVITGF